MDFGVSLVCSDNSTSVFDAAAKTKQNLYGSGDDWRESKVAKTTTMLFQEQHKNGSLLRSNGINPMSHETQQMLSFSSPNSQSVANYSSNAFTRNSMSSAGYGSVGLNSGSMNGVVTGLRGSFTTSQWMELEHQALIYKYITANVPIPLYLLNPISNGFSGLRHNPLGWGGFHLGFSNSTDPEPGRCRRTDGKKWRCSRDAVVDQKYCERHINRGRHRSRKLVEGQAAGTTTTTTAKLTKTSSSTAAAAAIVTGVDASDASNCLGLLQPTATNPSSTSSYLDRGFSIVPPSVKETQYSVPKAHNPYEDTSRTEFGLVCADSLVNPLNKSSTQANARSYGDSEDITGRETKSQHHPLRLFLNDNWPKNQSDQSNVSWPDADFQTDRTRLSISIPMVASDFMSSTSSPNNEKLTASSLSRDLEATQMGLGISNVISDQNQRQGNWIPITWESSMGGPLGEVLHRTNSSSGDCTNASALNLMTESWEYRSLHMASSPTGVLQKAAFCSHSNSSAGSSPRAENSKDK